MKKIIAIILSLLLTICVFAGCSKDTPATTDSAGVTTTQTAETEPQTTNTPETEAPATETEAPATETEATTQATEHAGNEVLDASDPVPAHWTLKEIGTIDNDNLYFYGGTMFDVKMDADDPVITAVNRNGEPILEEPVANIDNPLPGYYAISKISENINCTGLYTEDGKELAPADAAFYRTMRTANTNVPSERYLLAIYGTQKVENKNEAFFYTHDRLFSVMPDQDDTLYAGYATVYDLEKKAFVPNIKITNPNLDDVMDLGGYIVTENMDYSTSVYDAAGNEVHKPDKNADFGSEFYISGKDVYDLQGNVIYSGSGYLSVVKGSYKYITESNYSEKKLEVRDFKGGLLFNVNNVENAYASMENGGLFSLNLDGAGALYRANGEEVCKLENYYPPEYLGYGLWSFNGKDTNAKRIYVNEQGEQFEAVSKSVSKLVGSEDAGDGNYAFTVWNSADHKTTVKTGFPSTVTDALTEINDGSGYGLLELFGGEVVLPAEYRDIGFANGCIYAYKDNMWHVFELTLEY